MNYIKQLDKLKNLTVFQVLLLLLGLFIGYAITDVTRKVLVHKMYDMERLLLTIQAEYPQSKLTYQNICIIDNYMKRRTGRNSADYYEAGRYFIRNNRLHKEPNYLWALSIIVPVFIFFTVFCGDPRRIKLKDLSSVSKTAGVLLMGVVIVSAISWAVLPDDQYFLHRGSPKQFKNHSSSLIDGIELSEFLKPLDR
jgi:surface polysaccharide O-acyltransferase-like enzyme